MSALRVAASALAASVLAGVLLGMPGPGSWMAGGRNVASQDLSDDPLGVRARTQPDVWKRGTIRPFRTVADREKARAKSIADRSSRRAYHGAPPVMPHSAVFGEGTKTCLDCHTEGMTLGARVAHPMSHPPYSQCLQCHVEAASRQFEPGPGPGNDFAGLTSPGPGARQSAEAPPQVPHGLAMRGQCLSCHGEFGYPGVRTTHPERANCVQCHVVPKGQR